MSVGYIPCSGKFQLEIVLPYIIPEDARYIVYDLGCPDKTEPTLTWYVVGLIDTNEILVIGEKDRHVVHSKVPSKIEDPPMADRVDKGIDVRDLQLAYGLTNLLYEDAKSEWGLA